MDPQKIFLLDRDSEPHGNADPDSAAWKSVREPNAKSLFLSKIINKNRRGEKYTAQLAKYAGNRQHRT